jgi:NADH-quinone oxidoreductase subunit N
VVVVFARHHRDGEQHTLADYRGLARREPVASAVLAFGLACLAGLPPGIVGVVAKVIALRPVVDAGWWLLASVAAANIALAVAYYLRWAALLVAPSPDAATAWRLRPAEGLALGAAAAACVALSIAPQAIAALVPTLLR